MENILYLIEHYGLLALFIGVLLEGVGVPLPAYPIVLVSTALAVSMDKPITPIVMTGIGASLLADAISYYVGHRYGVKIIRTLCRVSMSPDSCVRDTTSIFARVGPVSLVFTKFIPGVASIAVTLAGVARVNLIKFAIYDMLGAAFYIGVGVALGAVFASAITDALNILSNLGTAGLILVGVALALFLGYKWWQRQSFIRQLRMDRITVDELRLMMEGGEQPVILDARQAATRALHGVIPGSIHIDLNNLSQVVTEVPHGSEVVVYCACPNEASAALLARRLKRAGFSRIRPLLGGIDAWIDAGFDIEPLAA